jgi:ribosomal protein S12 methylthiotransferase
MPRKLNVGLVTLGCDKNTVDMEYIAGMLARNGCDTVPLNPGEDGGGATFDAVVVLTCGFIADAKEQSVQSVVEWAERKKQTGLPRRLYVAGCLAQRHGAELFGAIPEIDGLLGVGQMSRIADMVREADAERHLEVAAKPGTKIAAPMPRRRIETGVHAYLKIADGCNHTCAFCAIPAMKGPYLSVPREILLEEAKQLLRAGVKELNLVAQDITVYGNDLYGAYGLPDLLGELCAIKGDFRVRCLYAYPGGINRPLLDAMASLPKIARYLDMPIQHVDPCVLKAMRRPARGADIPALVHRVRRALPGVALRTTVLVGFPGESPAAFRSLMQGLRGTAFEWLGAFAFSTEEGTPAARMAAQVPKRTRERRRARVMEQQANITAAFNASRVGRTVRVLVDSVDAETGIALCRSDAEAPEVDGTIRLRECPGVEAGHFLKAHIIEADVYDVTAVPE